MSTTGSRGHWAFTFVMAALIFAAIYLFTSCAKAGDTYDLDNDPEQFYLFNTTSRKYEDVLQWDEGAGSISMRCVNGTLTYKPYGNWMGLYLDDTLKVVSYWTVRESKGNILTLKSPWEFEDLGEYLVMRRYGVLGKVNVTEEWKFNFHLGEHPKLTFVVNNTGDKKLALDWELAVPRASIPKTTSYNATETKTMTVAGFIEVDWSDWNEKILVTEDSSNDKLSLRFKPDYQGGNFTIDPSVGFATNQVVDRSWVVISAHNTKTRTTPWRR